MRVRRLPSSVLCTAFLFALTARGPAQQDWENVLLQTAADAVRMSSQDAGKGLPVRVQGVVTWVSEDPPIFFVEDASGGVAVTGTRDPSIDGELHPGTLVDVQGITASGDTAPSITAPPDDSLEIRILGDGPLPTPRPARAGQLKAGMLSDSWVEIEGVVRAADADPNGPGGVPGVNVTFVSQGERFTANVPGPKIEDLPEQFVGATVRIRGVFHGTGLTRYPLLTNRFLANSLENISVEKLGRPPFELEVTSIGKVRRDFTASGIAERVRVQGLVTLSADRVGMFIENRGEALWVETPNPPKVQTSVDVAGFPGMRDGSVYLQDAQWRLSEIGFPPLVPTRITAEEAFSGAFNARIVKIEALLLTASVTGDGTTLVLQSGERVFLARTISAATRLTIPTENSWLQVTGVCVNNRAPRIASSGQNVANTESFHLLLSGPDAFEVARGPSWWTFRRIASVMGLLALAVAGTVGWAAALRRRVAEQTEQIRDHLGREAVAEERVRIARELHDSLQQDLLGITMQLKATERLIADPDRARVALQLAFAMVRRSQAETHRAIWDLRDDQASHPNLVSTLREVLRGLTSEGAPIIQIRGEGDVRPMPAAIENQMLRVAQEAVTNALKHGGAKHIEIGLRFEEERVTLSIRDDGRGFDADHPPAADSGHFGLFGMRERAAKINGDLRVTSKPGKGTAVYLDVPLTPDEHENYPTQIASAFRRTSRPTTS